MPAFAPRMPILARRALSAGEQRIGRMMFGREIDLDRVRIQQIPPAPFAAT